MPVHAAQCRGTNPDIDKIHAAGPVTVWPTEIVDAIRNALTDRLSRVDSVPDRELSVIAWQIVGEFGSFSPATAMPDGWQIILADRVRSLLEKHRTTLHSAALLPEPTAAPKFQELVDALTESAEQPISVT